LKEMKSNLQILSNLMLQENITKRSKLYHEYFSGDYLALMYPEYTDTRVMHEHMTKAQIDEFHQVLLCNKCRRKCAGTCEL
jgi:hypothetical protein